MRRVVVPIILGALVASGFALIASPDASAGGNPPQEYVVDRSDDADVSTCSIAANDCTLRGAINKANGDVAETTISFSSVVTTVDLTDELPTVTDALDIEGPSTLVTIDAAANERILSATAALTLADLLLQNGAPPEGVTGGAVNTNSPLVLEGNMQFQNNETKGASGGAIHGTGISATVTINGPALFFSNDVLTPGVNGGGCIRAQAITVNAFGAQFVNNTATGGGGCLSAAGAVLVNSATFSGNASGNRGGAISTALGGSVTAISTMFGGPDLDDGNTAGIGGGAIGVIDNSTINVQSSAFQNNKAGGGNEGGGAIYSSATARTSILDSTFTNNSYISNSGSAVGGGAVAVNHADGELTVGRSTFGGNSVTNNSPVGGAISVAEADAEITDSTFTGNAAGSGLGGTVYAVGTAPFTTLNSLTIDAGSTPSGAISNASLGTMRLVGSIVVTSILEAACTGVIVNGGNNLTFGETNQSCPGTVGNPGLGALQENGGGTATRLPSPTGPAVDAYAPDGLGDCETDTDQRGVTRPFNAACDIGAVELDLRPDGLIKKGTDPFLGLDLFNTDGTGQTYEQQKGKKKTAVYTIRVRSAAELLDDDITVTGGAGNKKFGVKYFNDSENITAAVTGAGYEATSFSPDEFRDLELRVKVKSKAKSGNQRQTLVTMTSGDLVDVVKAVTKRR